MGGLKTIDKKGRLALGTRYAGQHVQVVEQGEQLLVTLQRVVPAREAWLWENEKAFAMVERGIDQAHHGVTTEGPDLDAAFGLADDIPEE